MGGIYIGACPKFDMVWQYLSHIPGGRRGVIWLYFLVQVISSCLRYAPRKGGRGRHPLIWIRILEGQNGPPKKWGKKIHAFQNVFSRKLPLKFGSTVPWWRPRKQCRQGVVVRYTSRTQRYWGDPARKNYLVNKADISQSYGKTTQIIFIKIYL